MLNDLTPEQKAQLRIESNPHLAHKMPISGKVDQKQHKKRRAVWYWVGFAVLFITISAIVSAVSGNSRSFTTYTAPDGSFSASFPNTPQVKNSNEQIQGVSVPYTQYDTEIQNGNIAYLVQVVNFPSSDFDLTQNLTDELHGAVKGMASTTGATLISESDNESFLGNNAAEAHFTGSQDGQTYDMYSMNFLKDNKLYSLMTVGETKSNYINFTKSFVLN